jgi:ribonuclease III
MLNSKENLTESVFNEKNILLNEENLIILLKNQAPQGELKYNNINVYRTAFVHKSYCTKKNENFAEGNNLLNINCIPIQEVSNERLEFLGDSILGMVIASYLYERYEDENEGFLTKMRMKLVNGVMLSNLARKLNFNKYVIISKQIENNNGRNNDNILEDAFEAFIGAMYNDVGFELTKSWIVNVYEYYIDFSEIVSMNNNFKDKLIKHYYHTYQIHPKFEELDVQTENNRKIFHICVKNQFDQIIGVGVGGTKKKAEQEASKNAIIYLGL